MLHHQYESFLQSAVMDADLSHADVRPSICVQSDRNWKLT